MKKIIDRKYPLFKLNKNNNDFRGEQSLIHVDLNLLLKKTNQPNGRDYN